MNGKNRCRILKDIRRRIAEENNIEYITTECKYKGDCLGTCPKCEAEVRYLEYELERKRSLGYKVTVMGLAAGITLASVGCTPDTTSSLSSSDSSKSDIVNSSFDHSSYSESDTSDNETTEMGELPIPGELPDGSDTEVEIMGDFPPEDYSDEEHPMGQVPVEDDILMGEPDEYLPGDESDYSDVEIEEPTMGDLPLSEEYE